MDAVFDVTVVVALTVLKQNKKSRFLKHLDFFVIFTHNGILAICFVHCRFFSPVII